jgi:hypothetical protein
MREKGSKPAELPEYAVLNRAHWTTANARYTASHARDSSWAKSWPAEEIWRARKL